MLSDKEHSELAVIKASGPKGALALGDKVAFGQSIAGWVAQHRQPLVSPNHGLRMPGATVWKEEYGNGPFLAVPILGEEDVHGAVMACDKLNGGTFSEHDLVTAEMLANHLALCIEEGFLFWEGAEKQGFAPTLPVGKRV
jgi:hypothetical protein